MIEVSMIGTSCRKHRDTCRNSPACIAPSKIALGTNYLHTNIYISAKNCIFDIYNTENVLTLGKELICPIALPVSMVGDGIAPATANPEPCMTVSGHTAPQCTVTCNGYQGFVPGNPCQILRRFLIAHQGMLFEPLSTVDQFSIVWTR